MTHEIRGVIDLHIDTLVEAESEIKADKIVNDLLDVWSLRLKHRISMLKFGSPKFENLN